jgi:pyruvate kinase
VDILQWGVPNKIDMIALSFVRKGSDLQMARSVLGEHAKLIILMSKFCLSPQACISFFGLCCCFLMLPVSYFQVENQEGVANFDDILANSDAFMVARGEMGMEIPIEKIFYAQKVMIFKCNQQGKPVVTATQMLESMIKSLPTLHEQKPLMSPMLS